MKFSLKDLLDTISVTIISTLVMGLALHVVRRSIPYDGLFALVLMIATGVLVYFAMLWLLSRETLFQGINMFRKAFFKSRLVKPAPVEIVSKD